VPYLIWFLVFILVGGLMTCVAALS